MCKFHCPFEDSSNDYCCDTCLHEEESYDNCYECALEMRQSLDLFLAELWESKYGAKS